MLLCVVCSTHHSSVMTDPACMHGHDDRSSRTSPAASGARSEEEAVVRQWQRDIFQGAAPR